MKRLTRKISLIYSLPIYFFIFLQGCDNNITKTATQTLGKIETKIDAQINPVDCAYIVVQKAKTKYAWAKKEMMAEVVMAYAIIGQADKSKKLSHIPVENICQLTGYALRFPDFITQHASAPKEFKSLLLSLAFEEAKKNNEYYLMLYTARAQRIIGEKEKAIAGFYYILNNLDAWLAHRNTIDKKEVIRARYLCNIASELSLLGERQKASEILSNAEDYACLLRIAETDKKGTSEGAIGEIFSIIDAYIQTGQKDKAVEILNRLSSVAQRLQVGYLRQIEILIDIAKRYFDLQGKENIILSEAINERLLYSLERIKNKQHLRDKIDDLKRIIQIYKKYININQISPIITKTKTVIMGLGLDNTILDQEASLMHGLFNDLFDSIWGPEFQTYYRHVEGTFWKAYLLTQLVYVYMKIGDTYEIIQSLGYALEIARKIRTPYLRATLLSEIAFLYYKNKFEDQSFRIFAEARSTVDLIDETKCLGLSGSCGEVIKAETLTIIAQRYAMLGFDEKACKILAQALKLAQSAQREPTNLVAYATVSLLAQISQEYSDSKGLRNEQMQKVLHQIIKAVD
jgi:tetratricopeptide (TPR) repeat protein